MIWFKEAVVPTEIILEIIINKYTHSEFHILGFGENSVIFSFVLGYLLSFQLEEFKFLF